jgi:hypothetical protein
MSEKTKDGSIRVCVKSDVGIKIGDLLWLIMRQLARDFERAAELAKHQENILRVLQGKEVKK